MPPRHDDSDPYTHAYNCCPTNSNTSRGQDTHGGPNSNSGSRQDADPSADADDGTQQDADSSTDSDTGSHTDSSADTDADPQTIVTERSERTGLGGHARPAPAFSERESSPGRDSRTGRTSAIRPLAYSDIGAARVLLSSARCNT